MKGFVNWLNGSPKWLKIVFCLPGLGLIWGLYRLAVGIKNHSFLQTLLGVIMLFACPTFFWVVDLISVIITNRVFWWR